jgi:putative ABC transport system permease protein
MIKLTNVTKQYISGEQVVNALKGIDISFRSNEFVSILGPSGGGKTTLLNIIGGLDRYTEGDLEIDGTSTKDYRDKDWDVYRNHRVGFVFQTFNLIPHQTVLANVELALTISGVSKDERRRRAAKALEDVGLGDQLKKRPNQLSGGQMQRVAIARALVNDPEILLADEPTGALDTVTSVTIMDLLKDIAKDRLVVMVTHNPELAEEYSNRIINLKDGLITGDSKPFDGVEEETAREGAQTRSETDVKSEKASMSFGTALRLSLTNLMTKKGRTFMIAFAGSIGIIGIALILSLSTGVNKYIENVEEQTLSSYPLTIDSKTVDMAAMMGAMMGVGVPDDEETDAKKDEVTSQNIMNDVLNTVIGEVKNNDLNAFKEYIESGKTDIDEHSSAIQYYYDTTMNVYNADTADGIKQVNPSTVLDDVGLGAVTSNQSNGQELGSSIGMTSMMGTTDIWEELIGSEKLLKSSYDVLAGRLPEKYDEVVIITDKKHRVSDYTLYTLGMIDTAELKDRVTTLLTQSGDEDTDEDENSKTWSFTYDELLKQKYKMLVNTDYFAKEPSGVWVDKSDDEEFMNRAVNDGLELKVVGIICPGEDMSDNQVYGLVGYRSDLMEHLIDRVNNSEIVKDQKADKNINVFTGLEFREDANISSSDYSALLQEIPQDQLTYLMSLSEEERMSLLSKYMSEMNATYESNIEKMGVASIDDPSSIAIYPKDFEAKDSIIAIIDKYNDKQTDAGKEDLTIKYTDIVGAMMKSVTKIINAITYILIAFVSISLVVSSIMIGIITYISVLERTKEIGILRSIGASKRDISAVFNAETLIVGFVAGILGIVVTILLDILACAIVDATLDISNIAILPPQAGVALVAISMFLTFIAGLIPSGLAARRDPVAALRTE